MKRTTIGWRVREKGQDILPYIRPCAASVFGFEWVRLPPEPFTDKADAVRLLRLARQVGEENYAFREFTNALCLVRVVRVTR